MTFFKTLICFTSDATALEKILRLCQSICHILAAYSYSLEEAAPWLLLRAQFVLGRRFFRFFRFLECFSKATDSFHDMDGVKGVLLVGKWSFLGGYMFLESVTILDAIGYWPTPLARTYMLEGNKFWFCSLICSIFLGVLQFFEFKTKTHNVMRTEGIEEKSEKESSSKLEVEAKHSFDLERKSKLDTIVRKLLIDWLDLISPGFVTGWINTSASVVGFSSLVSTLLSLKETWYRLQQ